jgi:flagellar motor switch protein FliN/FliY
MEEKNKIRKIEFEELQEEKEEEKEQEIDFLSEIDMELKVELARTSQTTKDILTLEEGSVIKLDKIAGENVDILFNDKKIAKGEVVLVDEAYGIRITTFKDNKK